MSFHQRYNRDFLNKIQATGQVSNDASDYGVRIAEADVNPGETYWRVIGVHHLTPEENQGKHNAFVEVLDENGERVHDPSLRIGWTWEGRRDDERADPVPLDKPESEPAGNVPIQSGMNLEVWIQGDGQSDHVVNMNTRHPDELGPNGEHWNSFGHHSYYVVFQRTRKASPVEEPEREEESEGSGDQTDDQGDGSLPDGAEEPGQPQPEITVRIRAADKLGIDANAPIDPETGEIMPRVRDPNVIAATGVGWVRLNFILGKQWKRPTDPARPQGLTWAETYRQIIDGLRAEGLKIYGLISAEAMHEDPHNQFRDPPPPGPTDNDWIRRYAETFVTIAKMFHGDVEVFESFNEPDDWHRTPTEQHWEQSWIDPGWFAIMLQAIYDAMHDEPEIGHVTLVSGPVQGLQSNDNHGAVYLRDTYQAGKQRFGWGEGDKPFPFDGVGYHLYVVENPTEQLKQAIAHDYRRYVGEIRRVIREEEGEIKPIYISEMGWFSNQGRETFQVEAMERGLNLALRDPTVDLAIWFSLQDFGPEQGNHFYGLYSKAGVNAQNRKPAFSALKEIAHSTVEVPVTVPLPEIRPRPVRWIGRVTASLLNLRNGPSTDYTQIGQLAQGAAVKVLDQIGDWLHVLSDGQEGYVHGKWVLWQEPVTPAALPISPAPVPAGPFVPPPGQELDQPPDADPNTIAVVETWNRYGGLLSELANELGIDPAITVAVLVAESKGEPFGPGGRMTIRFENHIFYDYWGSFNEDQFRQHFSFNREGGGRHKNHMWRPDPDSSWLVCHTSQDREWQVFEFARDLDERAAMFSISMGAPQVMGFNHQDIGYDSVQEMFQAFQSSERAQIESLFRFMQENNLVEAVRNRDFASFARGYNGSAAADTYAAIIQDRLAIFNGLREGVPRAVPAAPAAPATRRVMVSAPAATRTPLPLTPEQTGGKPLAEADPELYAAWRGHIQQGFQHNNEMFQRILDGFMNPYYTTIQMYRILFGVGVASFLVAAGLSVWTQELLFGLIFGGLSVAAFLSYFLSRPLQALEENLQFITWLGVIYNTYWTRLAYTMDQETFHEDIEDATNDAIVELERLIDKHAVMRGKRPGLG